MKIDEKQIIEVLKNWECVIRLNRHKEPICKGVISQEFEDAAIDLLTLFKHHIPFTRAELQDLERLTAGTSEKWCQRLNAKFEEALGIKTVDTKITS